MSDSDAHVEEQEQKEAKGEEESHVQEVQLIEETAQLAKQKAEEQELAIPEPSAAALAEVTREEHPAGEVFFRGTAEEVTESEAEQIARRQLERSGLLRGQKVRVAD